jgi:hypothetical protein
VVPEARVPLSRHQGKVLSDSKDEIDAMNRGGHVDIRMAKTVYRRKPTEVIPLPRVSAKREASGREFASRLAKSICQTLKSKTASVTS